MRNKGSTISVVAREVGISSKTIRKWEKLGLIPIPIRTITGFRFYSDDEIQVLKDFIEQRYKANKINIKECVSNG